MLLIQKKNTFYSQKWYTYKGRYYMVFVNSDKENDNPLSIPTFLLLMCLSRMILRSVGRIYQGQMNIWMLSGQLCMCRGVGGTLVCIPSDFMSCIFLIVSFIFHYWANQMNRLRKQSTQNAPTGTSNVKCWLLL